MMSEIDYFANIQHIDIIQLLISVAVGQFQSKLAVVNGGKTCMIPRAQGCRGPQSHGLGSPHVV